MRRAAEDRKRTAREWQIHVQHTHKGDSSLCICDRQPGRFRKTKGRGCTKPQCGLCKPHKKWGRVPTRQEMADMGHDGPLTTPPERGR